MLLSICLSIFPSVCQSHASGSNMVYLGAMITIEHQYETPSQAVDGVLLVTMLVLGPLLL